MEIILLELLLLLIIAWFQVKAYRSNVQLLDDRAKVFPAGDRPRYELVTGSFLSYQIERADADFVQATIQNNHNRAEIKFFQSETSPDEHPLFEPRAEEVRLIGGYFANPVLLNIQRDVNIYLVRNNNRSTDSKIIQDIVERHCQIQGNMVESTMGLPLYYGLLGTIVGIIIGCIHISISGADDASNVSALLRTVALSMSVSGLGLWLTVSSMSRQKNTSQVLENGKNRFLIFVQSELLPVMRTDLQQTLLTMQRGLNHFNDSFQNNVARFDTSLGNISDNLSLQRSFLEKLEKIGFVQMVKETTGIFEQLGKSAEAVKHFRHYQESMNSTLSSLEGVVNNFKGLYDRTENFETSLNLIAANIGQQDATYHRLLNVLEENTQELETRKESLRRVIDGIDSFFRAQYEALSKQAEKYNVTLVSLNDDHISRVRESYENLQMAIAQKTEEIKKMAEKEMLMLEETYRAKQSTFDHLGRLPQIEKTVTNLESRQRKVDNITELTSVLKRLSDNMEEAEAGKFINWSALNRIFGRNNHVNQSTVKDE